MAFKFYIKRFCFILFGVFLLSSCDLIGGKEKIDTSENSVLSGPPLAIPPEFDIDSQNTNQQQSPPTDDMETFEQSDNIGSFENENENIFTDEAPAMTNIENTGIENTGEIQSFENFNPNVVRSNKQKNIQTNPTIQKTYRSSVPSDAYNFNSVIPRNQKIYAQKKKDNFVGFGNKIETGGSEGLSKEEAYLLEDILDGENVPESTDESIREFESTGDSD